MADNVFIKGTPLPEGAKKYRKKTLTTAVRIEGPFIVYTREGQLSCKDGYLAIDSGGFPYPIDREEFERIYEEIT